MVVPTITVPTISLPGVEDRQAGLSLQPQHGSPSPGMKRPCVGYQVDVGIGPSWVRGQQGHAVGLALGWVSVLVIISWGDGDGSTSLCAVTALCRTWLTLVHVPLRWPSLRHYAE